MHNKSRSFQWPLAQVLIQADTSAKGWGRGGGGGGGGGGHWRGGAIWNGISTGGMWLAQEMKHHINILELLAVKLAIQAFTKWRMSIHLQVDNIVVLTYLMKMEGTQNLKMVELVKTIWKYLLN